MLAKALAATFLVLGLASTFDAHACKVSAQALQAAQASGSVRVLVVLREPAVAKTRSGKIAARQQAVSSAVDGVLATLPAGGHSVYRRFELVPAAAMVADAATLQRLRMNPSVLRVDIDAGGGGHAMPPDEALVLSGFSALQAAGLDGAGMKVAVIDTGVDTDHVDLQPGLVAQQCFCSNPGGTGGCCPNGQATQAGLGAAEDDNGHGTHVAGIIVGQGLDAPRGALPGAQLVAVKVIDRNNRFCCTSDVVAAMDWVAANHPDVDAVNMSLGTDARFPGHCDAANAFTLALSSAIDSLVARGAVVTVSTGNEGDSNNTSAPACIAKAVGVGASWDFGSAESSFFGCTDTNFVPRQPTCFSNRSPTTDLYAAGAFVTSAQRFGGSVTFGGTSMAAPIVAACATALKQVAPVASVQQRIDAMTLSPVRVTDPGSGRIYPFLDCADAVRLLAPPSAPIRVNGAQPLVPHVGPPPPPPPPTQTAPARAERPASARSARGSAAQLER